MYFHLWDEVLNDINKIIGEKKCSIYVSQSVVAEHHDNLLFYLPH